MAGKLPAWVHEPKRRWGVLYLLFLLFLAFIFIGPSLAHGASADSTSLLSWDRVYPALMVSYDQQFVRPGVKVGYRLPYHFVMSYNKEFSDWFVDKALPQKKYYLTLVWSLR